ncbi:RNA methyltransferase, TrmH family [Paractinoplanes atraurantiacus]|uniref:RNA methyltransferase, TrmH family n=1 Tax=Paractinoplanes atraurantiacus TaxID=1036182 RepID=A0A285IPE5_9ACTN|nr:TrmH family RNA methyltransferase [Actinoplanes atraurantiacus]SNY49723.1 RNA methyltransferase, TrmH family [Actinoplanes atraurantiacus]
MRVTTRNASFQQWQALLTNRTKRHRAGSFLVHGVRPISLALDHGWAVSDLIYPDNHSLSTWARDALGRSGARPVAMAPDLFAELADKESAELVAVVRIPEMSDLPMADDPHLLVVVFDRPSTPGNIGTLIRSADAFGAAAVVITGHAADPYDPKSVRASTGSLFALPVIRAEGHEEVLSWVSRLRADGLPVEIVGTDEHGTVDVADYDLTGPRVLLVGNETTGLTAAWREAADAMVRIPITGAASSLNAATAATVVLYEVSRQRSHGSARG